MLDHMPLHRDERNFNWEPRGIQMSDHPRCPLRCVEVLSWTYHQKSILFSDNTSFLPISSKFYDSCCSCEKDFSMNVTNEVLSLIVSSVCCPSAQEMIDCTTTCYWGLRMELLEMYSKERLIPNLDDKRCLPPCFHRTLLGIPAIASQMRLAEDDKEFGQML